MASLLQAKASGSIAADQDITYNSDVTAGSLLVLTMREGATPTANPTITDSQGNTWMLVERQGRNTIACAIAGGSGPLTVSINADNTNSTRAVVFEFSGNWPADPRDVISAWVNNPTSPAVSGAATPSGASGVMIGFLGCASDSQPFSITAGGYTLGPVHANRVAPSYLCFSSSANYSVTYTTGSGISSGATLQNVAFVESAAPSGPNPAAERAQSYPGYPFRY